MRDDCQSAEEAKPRVSLKDDQRGAVLMIAVFMAAFLVGALWYIIGIGDAAVYRQYMQDGADATAFGAAVYHARGMNILALINLIMAAVLAVLVAFKIAQILLLIANIASCIAGAIFNPVCDLTTAAEEPFATLVDKVETAVDKILRALHAVSNGVAIGMPWVAEVKAVVVANSYAPTVRGGFMTSTSQIPGALEKATGGGGERLGLPVQDDDFSVLCDHAGRDVVSFVFLPFSFLPGIGDLIGGVSSYAGGAVGGLVSTFPAYFCGGGPAVDTGKFTKGAGGKKLDPKKICGDRAKEAKKKGVTFDEAACEKSVGGSIDSLGKGTSGTVGSTTGKESKRVYDPARNGDDYFAVWGFDYGDLKKQSDAGKGVDIAGWGKAKVGDPSIFGKFQFAKAEFYYEPKSSDGKTWSDYEDEAMWNMRWRARLRRFRLPKTSIGTLLSGPAGVGGPAIDTIMAMMGGASDIVPDSLKDAVGVIGGGGIIH